MDLRKEITVEFDDGVLVAYGRLQYAEQVDTTPTVDDDGTIRTRAPLVLLDLEHGHIQYGGEMTEIQPGRYAVLGDGLYRKVDVGKEA